MAERPARKRGPKTKYEAKHTFWKLKEKKALLNAMKIHSPDDIASLQKEVKTKSIDEVGKFVDRIKRGAVHRYRTTKGQKAPIENWLQLLKDLTLQEKKDYTVVLGRVLSIAGNFEDHPPPSSGVPDYRAIYKFLSALLLEKDLPDLGKLESAVILDLLHSLVDVLRTHDKTRQTQIMEYKYELLSCKVDMADPLTAVIKARKALENDFSDFEDTSVLNKDQNVTNLSSETPDKQGCARREDSNTDPNIQRSNDHNGDNDSGTTMTSYLSDGSILQPPLKSVSDQTNHEEQHPTDDPKIPVKKKLKRTNVTPDQCPKKPAFFTLNPFCIPVKLLKMKTVFRSQMERQEMQRQHIVKQQMAGNLKTLPQIVPRKNACIHSKKVYPVKKETILVPGKLVQKKA